MGSVHGASAADVHGAQPRPWQPARSDAEYAAYNTVRRPGRAVARSPGASGQRTGRHRRGPVRRTAASAGVSQAAAKSRPPPRPERCRSPRSGPHGPVPPRIPGPASGPAAVPGRFGRRRREEPSPPGGAGAAGRSRGRRREGTLGRGPPRARPPAGDSARPGGRHGAGRGTGARRPDRGGGDAGTDHPGGIVGGGAEAGSRRRDRGGAARGGPRRRERGGGRAGRGYRGAWGTRGGSTEVRTVSAGRAGPPPGRSGSPGTPPGSLLPRSLLVPGCGRDRPPHSPRPVLSSA